MSHKKECIVGSFWAVRHVDGSYLVGAHGDSSWWRWADGHIRRDRYATKEEAIAAREKMRASEKRCSHTARIIKVTVRR